MASILIIDDEAGIRANPLKKVVKRDQTEKLDRSIMRAKIGGDEYPGGSIT